MQPDGDETATDRAPRITRGRRERSPGDQARERFSGDVFLNDSIVLYTDRRLLRRPTAGLRLGVSNSWLDPSHRSLPHLVEGVGMMATSNLSRDPIFQRLPLADLLALKEVL